MILMLFLSTPSQRVSSLPSVPSPGGLRFGLSLLELVIALGLLALLATVAVRSLEPIADQSRIEATRRLLEDVASAIRGEAVSVGRDQLRSPGGLLADCGFVPGDSSALLVPPPGVAVWSVQNFDSDNDGTADGSLASGWNGPYLQLPVGRSRDAAIEDGWGRPLDYDAPEADTLQIVSLGSDNAIGGDGAEADLVATVLPQEFRGSVVFRAYQIDEETGMPVDPELSPRQQMGVRFYGVNAAGGTAGRIEKIMRTIPDFDSFEVRLEDRLHGPAAARALLWEDANGNNILDSGESVVQTSRLQYFIVHAGEEQRFEMLLREPGP
jgi:type II secretory pathway pseudopilin PulG